MAEQIDFSNNENEYLPKGLVSKVIIISLAWAVCGFLLSAWLFWGQNKGPATKLLDRQAAEGRIVSSGAKSGRLSGGFYSYSAGTYSGSTLTLAQSDRDRWTKFKSSVTMQQSAAPSKQPSPSPTPITKVVIASASLSSGPQTPKTKNIRPSTSKPRTHSANKDTSTVLNSNPSPSASGGNQRLLYPSSEKRPERQSLADIALSLQQNAIKLNKIDGGFHTGLLLDNSGKAIASSDCLRDDSLNRILVDGRITRARVIARDEDYRLVLLQLQDSVEAVTIPLAPSPPAKGEQLLSYHSRTANIETIAVRAGPSFTQGGFFSEGSFSESSLGAALLNDRGELAGCRFESIEGIPGSGIQLAADSSVVFRLLRGYNSAAPGLGDLVGQAVQELASIAKREPKGKDSKRNRILAGVGISQFYIGMTRQEAGQWIKNPLKEHSSAGIEKWTSQAPRVELSFASDYLVAVATDFSGYSTEDGLSLSSAIDGKILERAYGDDFIINPTLALVPGLDIILSDEQKADLFLVKPRF